MPGLVQRYNVAAEYSALMSTNPNALQRRLRRRQEAESPALSTCASIRDEASEWYEAIAPPLEDLQAVIRGMQADPDFTQGRIFSYLRPVVVLGTLFAVAAITVRGDAYVHRIINCPDNYWQEVGRFVALAMCGVAFSVLSLKCIIYGFAELCAVIVSMETKEQMKKKEKKGVPTSGLILGGMSM